MSKYLDKQMYHLAKFIFSPAYSPENKYQAKTSQESLLF